MILTMTLLGGSEAASASGRTIVGEWAPDPRQCTPMAGAISILPLAIVGDDMRCDFSGVSRAGDVVTWRGRCGFPDPAKPTTVVAALRGEALSIRFNGSAPNQFRRCAR